MANAPSGGRFFAASAVDFFGGGAPPSAEAAPGSESGGVNILEGIAAVRQPITKPAWLARMKHKGGTISTTSAPPQAQGPAQRRRLKSITGFSSRRRHSTEEPFGSANRLQQLRPVSPYLAPARAACKQLRTNAAKHMTGSFTGLSAGSIETRSDKRPPIRSCIHYQILWLSRFASATRLESANRDPI